MHQSVLFRLHNFTFANSSRNISSDISISIHFLCNLSVRFHGQSTAGHSNRGLKRPTFLAMKVKSGLMPTYITEIFNTAPKRYNLRNADFNIPRFRTVQYGKHSLRYFGPHLWDTLEKSDRENPNFMAFKKSIKSKDLSLLINDCKTVIYAARPL